MMSCRPASAVYYSVYSAFIGRASFCKVSDGRGFWFISFCFSARLRRLALLKDTPETPNTEIPAEKFARSRPVFSAVDNYKADKCPPAP